MGQKRDGVPVTCKCINPEYSDLHSESSLQISLSQLAFSSLDSEHERVGLETERVTRYICQRRADLEDRTEMLGFSVGNCKGG